MGVLVDIRTLFGFLNPYKLLDDPLPHHGLKIVWWVCQIKCNLSTSLITLISYFPEYYINGKDYCKLTSLDNSMTNGVVHIVNRVIGLDLDTSGSTVISSSLSTILLYLISLFLLS